MRGNNRRELFADDGDRRRFVERLEAVAEDCDARIYAFCLMTNHVHLVVETPRANLGQFMHKLETGYTVYYNRRHQQSGHLTQGRYGAKAVEGDAYLLALTRYVHLNPVYVGSVARSSVEERVRVLRQYAWSSYRTYLGRATQGWVATGPLLAMMAGRSQARKRAEFRRFVEAALAEQDDEFLAIYKGSRLGIGGEEFLAKMGDLYAASVGARPKVEDVALHRVRRRLGAEQIVVTACRHLGVACGEERQRRRENWARPVVARMLSRYGGLTQREIAQRLGVATGKSVCAQLQRLDGALPDDRSLSRLVAALEQELKTARDATNY